MTKKMAKIIITIIFFFISIALSYCADNRNYGTQSNLEYIEEPKTDGKYYFSYPVKVIF